MISRFSVALLTAVRLCAGAEFYPDVASIIHRHCVGCHQPGQSAPFPLLSYNDVAKRGEFIAEVTRTRYMPPWMPESGYGEFEHERRLTDRELKTISEWVDAGMLEGSPESWRPPPKQPGPGEPDLILRMSDAYEIPADGADVFRHFAIDIPIDSVKYVRGFEFFPGNPRIVHHSRMMFDRTGQSMRRERASGEHGLSGSIELNTVFDPSGHWIGWTPGKSAILREPELAWELKPGVDLVLELHMLPTGKPETIQAALGLYLTDRPPSRQPTILRLGKQSMKIPAGAPAYVMEDSYVLPVDVQILNVYPHCHYLGKSVEGYAIRPDGSRVELLRISEWNFDWQDEYQYAEPVRLPKGTVIHARFVYDNSAENPRNPSQPPRPVNYGWQTSEEMGDLWFQVLTDKADRKALVDDFASKEDLEQMHGIETQIEMHPDDIDKRTALSAFYIKFDRLGEARGQLEEALKIDPRSSHALFNMGLLEERSGNIEVALDTYRQAVALDSSNAPAYNNLGLLLAREGRVAEGIEALRRATEARAGYAAALGNLGRLLLLADQPQQAIATYYRALEADPNMGIVHFNLAVLRESASRTKDALQHYEAAAAGDYETAARMARDALARLQLDPQ